MPMSGHSCATGCAIRPAITCAYKVGVIGQRAPGVSEGQLTNMVFIMKKRSTALLAALMTVTLCGNVHADWERGHRPWPNASMHRERGHGGDWVAPLVFLGLAGAVLAANSQPSLPPVVYAAPASTYVVPEVRYAVPAPAPVNALYYCQSVGRYFPNTQYCPEGWQLVQR